MGAGAQPTQVRGSAKLRGAGPGVRPPRGAAFLPRGRRAAARLPGKTKGKEISSIIRKREQKKQMT